jgi:hypothetical protein
MKNQINCFKCKYYYITWDKHRPNGCKYFGFKGKVMPSQTVKNSSKEECKAFILKNADH